jgi:hypothetical protein
MSLAKVNKKFFLHSSSFITVPLQNVFSRRHDEISVCLQRCAVVRWSFGWIIDIFWLCGFCFYCVRCRVCKKRQWFQLFNSEWRVLFVPVRSQLPAEIGVRFLGGRGQRIRLSERQSHRFGFATVPFYRVWWVFVWLARFKSLILQTSTFSKRSESTRIGIALPCQLWATNCKMSPESWSQISKMSSIAEKRSTVSAVFHYHNCGCHRTKSNLWLLINCIFQAFTR